MLAALTPGCDDEASGSPDDSAPADVAVAVDARDPRLADRGVDAGVVDPLDAGSQPDLGADVTPPDAAPPDAAPDRPPPPETLPFEYVREDQGDLVTADAVAAATEQYREILETTRFFAILDERVHGWPESDEQGRYWYGTWWSGVTIRKQEGQVTYLHSADGADNNGLRTAQLMEAACYGYALWGEPELQHLTRRMIRGFNAWMLAMESTSHPDRPALLTRASYPESVFDADLGVFIDYGLNHPGEDNGATEYVRIPDNPYWGDIWVKNKRSKDDIGHMLRAVAQVQTCAGLFTDDAAEQDLAEMRRLYRLWSQQVERDGWRIRTIDQAGEEWIPPDLLATFIQAADTECIAILAVRLMGAGDPGDHDCGDGIHRFEDDLEAFFDSSNAQIIRGFHEAAANLAVLSHHPELALTLTQGLARRIEQALDRIEAGEPPSNMNTPDFVALMAHAANIGVSLTSREIRWLHQRIAEAHAGYAALGHRPEYAVLHPDTPDGDYSLQPGGPAIDFTNLGLLLGSCASRYRNPTARPIVDCEQVRSWR